jgi:hypothetical protein
MRSWGTPFAISTSFLAETNFISQDKIVSRFYSDLIIQGAYARKMTMSKQNRILLALGIILLDLIVFFLPLAAFFLAYVIVYNPPWAKDFFERLD